MWRSPGPHLLLDTVAAAVAANHEVLHILNDRVRLREGIVVHKPWTVPFSVLFIPTAKYGDGGVHSVGLPMKNVNTFYEQNLVNLQTRFWFSAALVAIKKRTLAHSALEQPLPSLRRS